IHPSLLYHLQLPPLPLSTLFPYTTLFRSNMGHQLDFLAKRKRIRGRAEILSKGQDMTIRELRSLLERYNVRKKTLRKALRMDSADRKSTRLNSSHVKISYAVFCLKKKNYN